MQKKSHSASKRCIHHINNTDYNTIISYALLLLFIGLSIIFIVLYFKTKKTCKERGPCEAPIQELLLRNPNSTFFFSIKDYLYSISFVLTNLSADSITALTLYYPRIDIFGHPVDNSDSSYNIISTTNFNITDNMLFFSAQQAFDAAHTINKRIGYSASYSNINISVSANTADGSKAIFIPCGILVTYFT